MKDQKEKKKPKYNMWQNSAYMISLAWREKEKKVIFLVLLLVFCTVCDNLISIYFTPTVLAAVENRVPVTNLILTICSFVGAGMFLSAFSNYLNTNTLYGRVQVRSAIITALNRKAATTSYPNVGDQKFIKLHTKASEATSSNSQATEAIWNTLGNLTQNIINMAVYVLLLTTLEPWMMILVLGTTLIGYAVNRYLGGYDYRHREELAEYENRIWYIGGRVMDYSAAKDIHIFGLKPWLEELGAKAMNAFKYPGSEEYALKHVSMKFGAGERLAVVGQNGSGKTTFIKLLCRLYDPTEGMILLNGTDIKEFDYLEYMAIFSVVFQDFKLFAFSLGQNVGTKVAYDSGLAEGVLRKAGFGDRLDTFGDGLETYLYKDFSKKGVDISGGEAQKIALARTLYKDAPFIVLDEPTAALDPVAESEVYSNFNDIVGKKTAIYISHRLSSCRFCNDILVFHEGNLVQRGSHEQLSADKAGKYYELWNAQAQYYNT